MNVRTLAPRFGALSAVLFLAACAETDRALTAPAESQRPVFAISDGVHSSGNAHFFFLPPLVPQPNATGTFDGTLAPVVEICEWAESCGVVVARYTTQTGTGGNAISRDPSAQLYQVNWDTKVCESGSCALDPAKTYRVRVLVAGTQLGFADLDVVANGSQLKNVQTADYIGLVNSRTLPVKFRIEQGAVAVIGASGGTAVLADGQVSLVFPAGALPGDAGVTASPVSSEKYPADRPALLGTLYEFQPSPITFAQPVQLTLRYPASLPPGVQESRLVVCKVSGIRCSAIPGSTRNPANRTVSAPIAGFSEYGVIENPDPFDFVYRAQDGIHRLTNDVDVLVVPLNRGEAEAWEWSPNGMEVLWVTSNAYGLPSIYRGSIDGSGVVLVAGPGEQSSGRDDSAEHADRPAWSPDGTSIAYLAGSVLPAPENWHLRIKNLITGQVADFPDLNRSYISADALSWSPDGRYVALMGAGLSTGLVILEVGTGQHWEIAPVAGGGWYNQEAGINGFLYNATWSPDSRRLAALELDAVAYTIYEVKANGSGAPRAIVTSPTDLFAPLAWSPTAETILFSILGEQHTFVVRTVNVDGSGLRDLMPGDWRTGHDQQLASWSPDGRWITFMIPGEGHFVVRPDGTELQEVHPLGDGGGFAGLQWNPSLKRLP